MFSSIRFEDRSSVLSLFSPWNGVEEELAASASDERRFPLRLRLLSWWRDGRTEGRAPRDRSWKGGGTS